jgi:hypothetical protein
MSKKIIDGQNNISYCDVILVYVRDGLITSRLISTLYDPSSLKRFSIRFIMELFQYVSDYQIWICQPCRYAMSPSRLLAHLTQKHGHDYRSKTQIQRQRILEEMLKKPWVDPCRESLRFPPPASLRFPPPASPPIPGLTIHQGYQCPGTTCSFIAVTRNTIRRHLTQHPEIPKNPRGTPRAFTHHTHIYPRVYCQRFFITGMGSQYFAVTPSLPIDQEQPAAPLSAESWIAAKINTALAQREAMIEVTSHAIQSHGAHH